MKCLTFVLFISAFGFLGVASGPPRPKPPPPPPRPSPPKENSTLLLVHTVFRHGDRTPNSGVYDSNPYGDESYYWPFGWGQLTNDGKRTEYRIGTSMRERYNDFLGDVYNINILDATTTNVNRTKQSLMLMLAGLFPAKGDQIWNADLDWLAIPYNYYSDDKQISGTSVCSNYNTLKKEVENSDEIQEKLSVYDEIFEYVSNNTGETFDSVDEIFSLYFESVAQEGFGYPVEEWMNAVYPDDLEKITKDKYYIGTNTTALKKIAGGFLLRKIINDSKAKIDGLLTPESRKLFIYSAHEMNVANFLITLGVYEDLIPAYGSHVLVELHNIDGVYGFKVLYDDWTDDSPRLLVIPGCEAFCPYDEFVELLSEVIPEDSDCETS